MIAEPLEHRRIRIEWQHKEWWLARMGMLETLSILKCKDKMQYHTVNMKI